jgi:23S rRNA pseudouridine1911/1915/1917 synthase
LLKDHDSNVVTVARPGTPEEKACALSYRVLKEAKAATDGRLLTWLEVRPHTGRSHQIRVQLSSRGWPIYGDRKYGAANGFDGAIALHAHAVTFEHPVSKEKVTVTVPVPESWRAIEHGS